MGVLRIDLLGVETEFTHLESVVAFNQDQLVVGVLICTFYEHTVTGVVIVRQSDLCIGCLVNEYVLAVRILAVEGNLFGVTSGLLCVIVSGNDRKAGNLLCLLGREGDFNSKAAAIAPPSQTGGTAILRIYFAVKEAIDILLPVTLLGSGCRILVNRN